MSDAHSKAPWHREGFGGSEIVGADGEGICRIYKVDGRYAFDPTTPAGDRTEGNAALIVRLANLYFAGKALSARRDDESRAHGNIPADGDFGLTEAEIACAQMMNGLLEQNEELLTALWALIDKRDRPHGFPDPAWYEAEFEQARAVVTKARGESPSGVGMRPDAAAPLAVPPETETPPAGSDDRPACIDIDPEAQP